VLCGALFARYNRIGISNDVKVSGVGEVLLDEGTDLWVAVLHGLFIADSDWDFGMRIRIHCEP